VVAAAYRAVSPSYFQTLGVPLVRGRVFAAADDDPKAPPVAVVNASFAARHFPGESAVGKRIVIGYGEPVGREIVGVVGDVLHEGLDRPAGEEMYTPFAQTPWPFLFVTLRADAPQSLVAPLAAAVRALDSELPIDAPRTMDQAVADSLAERRVQLLLFGVFAAVALALATIGLYGVMAYTVSERTRELGIRAALGAAPRDLLRMVIIHALRLAALGITLGLALALALGRLLAGLLYGVAPTDPLTFAAIATLLVAVALAATWLPARRAMTVDPVVALRSD
jgi:putative ABC transport system permease protein